MDSIENEGGPGDLNELKKLKESDNTLDFKLITLETKKWRPPAEIEDRVYLQPNDETETIRDDLMDKFTVGAEILSQFPLIKTILADDKDNEAYKLRLKKLSYQRLNQTFLLHCSISVYLHPNNEDDTNRAEFMDKFTVGSEIFNQLLLIKNQLVLDDSDQTTAYEIQLLKVESNNIATSMMYPFSSSCLMPPITLTLIS